MKTNAEQKLGTFGLITQGPGGGPWKFNMILSDKLTSFRNGYSVTGKSYLNEFSKPKIAKLVNYRVLNLNGNIGVAEIHENGEHFVENPYILFPTDNLIFGWQLPLCLKQHTSGFDGFASTNPTYPYLWGPGAKLTFKTSPQKIILYGSYIKEGKEHHDTLNQLLTNDNIHEIIGDD
jgi:hypothetical protein